MYYVHSALYSPRFQSFMNESDETTREGEVRSMLLVTALNLPKIKILDFSFNPVRIRYLHTVSVQVQIRSVF